MNGFAVQLLQGFAVTLYVAAAAFALALLIGTLAAWGKLSAGPVLSSTLALYTTVARGVPELVSILLIFFGVPVLVHSVTAALGAPVRIALPPFLAGTITLALIYGAFATEVIRGAAQSLDRGQFEAAKALGLPRIAALLRVTGPQIARRAAPGLANVWLILLKATSLLAVIQVDEVMRKAQIAARATREPFTWYLAASLLYLVASIASMALKARLERGAEAKPWDR
jgi:His/Glu/Gln/Arg/opine family amino acid ABC transporter permease subunit